MLRRLVLSLLSRRRGCGCLSTPSTSDALVPCVDYLSAGVESTSTIDDLRNITATEEDDSWLLNGISELSGLDEKVTESLTLPKEMSRREVYQHNEQVKQAKSDGVGIVDLKVESLVVKELQRRSTLKTSMADLNVALFNMHDTRLAERLIARNVRSIALIEASQANALYLKEFAKRQKKDHKRHVSAYRASIDSVFPPFGRKKKGAVPGKLLFGDKSLVDSAIRPLRLSLPRSDHDESGDASYGAPVLVAIGATASQQLGILGSLSSSALLHLCRLNTETIFKYGVVQLVTFFSAGNYAFVVCGMEDDLRFMSLGHRYRSWLFNKLFEVSKIDDGKGIARSSFRPMIPLTKPIPYEKKLTDVGIVDGLMYGVAIKPRECVRIGAVNVVSNGDCVEGAETRNLVIPTGSLLHYAFWIETASKLTMKANVSAKLKLWFPESANAVISLIGGDAKAGDLGFEELDTLFCAIREELSGSGGTLRESFDAFLAKYTKASAAGTVTDYAD